MDRQSPFRALLAYLLVALLLTAPAAATTSSDEAGGPPEPGLVRQIVGAPVVPVGLVTGRPTDVVIDLDAALDPSLPGRTPRAGGTIRVTLLEAFERHPGEYVLRFRLAGGNTVETFVVVQ